MKLKNKGRNEKLITSEIIVPEKDLSGELNLYTSYIPAGFPSPAEDFMEKRLDLNEYLVRNQAATFLIRVTGNSMVNTGIFDQDLLVIDRSVEPTDGKIVLGVLNGEFTVKRIRKTANKLILEAANDDFRSIEVNEEMDFQIWGVVTFSIHKT